MTNNTIICYYIYMLNTLSPHNSKKQENNWVNYVFFEDKELIWETLLKTLENVNKSLKNTEKIAYHDNLTWLLNRHWLDKKIEEMFLVSDKVSVWLFDIDGLKQINTVSYSNWDHAIETTAKILKNTFKPDNPKSIIIIARLWWDEFIIVSNNPNIKEFEENIKKSEEQIKKENKKDISYKLWITMDFTSWVTKEKIDNTIKELHNNLTEQKISKK